MESILTLDRLRQSVAVKELLQAKGQPLMRKTVSVPNFSQVWRTRFRQVHLLQLCSFSYSYHTLYISLLMKIL